MHEDMRVVNNLLVAWLIDACPSVEQQFSGIKRALARSVMQGRVSSENRTSVTRIKKHKSKTNIELFALTFRPRSKKADT
jgi:hypothetical protein